MTSRRRTSSSKLALISQRPGLTMTASQEENASARQVTPSPTRFEYSRCDIKTNCHADISRAVVYIPANFEVDILNDLISTNFFSSFRDFCD
jgi:hypothetical protein